MERRIQVLMAVDEPYAAPLAVTVTSLLEHLRPAAGVDLYVMTSGLGPGTRRTLERAWGTRVRLRWVSINDSKLDVLRGRGGHLSTAANFRLAAGSSLPDVPKVIYLDADLLIRRDILELWERDLQGQIVLAVQDSYIQRPYFNSGVMVIDLDAWRAAGIEDACLDAARRLRHQARWLDQDVLNVCLAGRWGSLPPAWNKQFALDLCADWQCSPYEEREFLEARTRPAIIHFCTRTKPWHAVCDHPAEDVRAYRATLLGTAYAGTLRGAPSVGRRVSEFFAWPHRRLRDTAAIALRARRRRHALQAMLPAMTRLAVLHPWTLASVPLAVALEQVVRRGRGKLRRTA